jgi:peptide/nickel transport system substrate-binding protein
MQRRISFLVGAAAVVLIVATSATATSRTAATPRAEAAPFAEAWAHVPRTSAGREAKSTMVVAMEQDLPGSFNTNYQPSHSAWSLNVVTPVLAGVYNVTNKFEYLPWLVSKVTVTKQSITYDIRPQAVWNWGGKKVPVTYRDFVYTWKATLNPRNSNVSVQGVNQLASYTHKGSKQITFYWKTASHHPTLPASWETPKCTPAFPCGPFADYKDIFGYVYPSFALKGMNFNTMWATGIVGSNGKYISDGPFYVSNYTKGQGVTEMANPLWWGAKQHLKELDFKVIADTNAEIEAIRGGEVDVAWPQPQTALATLIGVKGLTYKIATGLYLEHIDLQEGPTAKDPRVPLMRAPWFRQAIMLGLNRQGLVNALFDKIAPGLKPLDSLEFYPSDTRYRPDFAKWNYNPQKAINLLKAHGCTGGPNSPSDGNTQYWTCAGYPAAFAYTTAADNSRRVTSETIFKANLQAIGIKVTDNLLPSAVMFDDTHLTAGNYDAMEFAWGGVLDSGSGNPIWSCNGGQNYLHYCNAKVTSLLSDSNAQLNTRTRNVDFAEADKIMADQVPSIPLYDLPDVVTYKSNIAGVFNNATGFTWDTEQWRWTS